MEQGVAANGRRILVVGINYAPEHTGIAPYTTQACDHLADGGAEVFAITGVPHYPHWSVPAPYRRRLRAAERHGAVAVRRLRHTVPARQSARSRATYEATFGAHVLAQRLPQPPDVVLAVVPSLFGSAAALQLARRANAPLVLWVQDLMGPATAQSGIAGGNRIARMTTALETRVLRGASDVIVVSGAFRPYVEVAGVDAQHIHVVPNWTHVANSSEDRVATRRRLGWADDELIALHSGNMGLKQGLDNVVEAARLARSGVRIVIMGDGNQREALQRLGAGIPALEFLPPAPSEAFPAILAAADVLLVNERRSAVDMSLPSKLTSYFVSGLPVLAAVPPDGGTAAEVARSGGGRLVAAEDPAALLAALHDLRAQPEERARLGAAGALHARENLSASAALGRISEIVAAAALHRRS